MKFIPSFGEITSKTKDTFKRFPITLLWAIIGSFFTLFAIENDTFDNSFTGRIILIFTLGISWLITTRFFEEQFKKNKTWLFLITFGFLVGFYFSISIENNRIDQNSIIRFILYFIAGHLLIMVAPFILRWHKSAYFNYLKAVFVAIIRSLFFSLILYLGVVLALLAIKHLFNVDFKGDRFFQIFVISMGIVNTWIYLSDFPKDVHNQTIIDYTKALEVLVKYILIPLVILYLIILYAYSLKIVINWSLPKGWVSYLVVALSFLGFSIQILINPIQKTIASRTIKRFYPWFYYLLLPLIGLLFVAIFRRINEYGITENRYFVFALALWILAMTLYMLFSKKKKIKVFPFSLAIIAMVVSFGFWGVFTISTNSQVRRFEKVYTDIKNSDFATTFEKKNQLRSIVGYLNDKNDLDKLESILGYNPKASFKTESHWQLQNKLMDTLHIKVTDKINDPYENHYFNINENNMIINVKDYDILKRLYINRREKRNSINGYHFSLGKKSSSIKVIKNDTLVGEIDCSKMIQNLKNHGKTYNINPDFMTLEESFNNLNVKLIFLNVNLNRDNDTETEKTLSNVSVYALIKEKNAE
ncbi:DUF4153 domain-containing protein [Tenacibaculum crassostreae]|uniref:DUF4153 domain-containing protein n=1 Tax=Tenacibaculum crassostreae TaxID=502683 RepID=UPI0038959795